jgi:hypothetical protein
LYRVVWAGPIFTVERGLAGSIAMTMARHAEQRKSLSGASFAFGAITDD